MAVRSRRIARLPKAPLVEVVFELHWRQQAPSPLPGSDPGLLPLLENFTSAIKKVGFGFARDMSPAFQTGAHSVVRRLYKEADAPFPIMQVGPGIFATNESSLYEWSAYKKQINLGLQTLFASYPKLGFFRMEPIVLELRYINVFDGSLLGSATMFDFVNRGTSLKIQLPKMLTDRKLFGADAQGRVAFVCELRGWKGSQFALDLGSVESPNQGAVVRLETKVRSEGDGVPPLKNARSFVNKLDEWLEFAHGITSPFFREFVLPEVMKKFQES